MRQLPATVEAPPSAVGYYLNVERLERLELASDRVHTRQRYRRERRMVASRAS